MKYFALYRLLIIVATDGVCLYVYIKYPARCTLIAMEQPTFI